VVCMRLPKKIEVSGTGLGLVSWIGPTLGIPIPELIRWSLFALGALMIIGPSALAIYQKIKMTGSTVSLVGMVISGLFFIGFAAWHFWPQGRSGLSSTITDVSAFDDNANPGALMVIPKVDIRSTEGGASIAGFSLTIKPPVGPEMRSSAQPVFEPHTFRGPDASIVVTPETTLWGRDGAPPIHGFRSGRLWFAFNGLKDFSFLNDNDTRLILNIEDSAGGSHESEVKLGDLGPRLRAAPFPSSPEAPKPAPIPQNSPPITSLSPSVGGAPAVTLSPIDPKGGDCGSAMCVKGHPDGKGGVGCHYE
jgi:hypothetical protein